MKPPSLKGAQPWLLPMATTIQTAMRQRGLNMAQLTEALGLEPRQRVAVYNWTKGKNGPSELNRAKLAEILGLTVEQVTAPYRPGAKPGAKLGPAQRAVALVETARANGEMAAPVAAVSDVFVIKARSDGTLAIRLDVNLPFAKGTVLMRYLLEFGLGLGGDNP